MGLEFKTTLLVLFIGILAYSKFVISPSSSSSECNTSLSNHVCNISKLRATKNMHKSVSKCNNYIFTLLIITAHDTETNPGPQTPKWPCGTCHKAVTWKHKALCCDTCDTWYHIDCQGMSPHLYPAMESSNVSWHCLHCGLPNFSTTLFDSYVETSNIYSALDSLVESDLNVSQLGEPTATSSPARPTKVNNKRPKGPHIVHLSTMCNLFEESAKADIFVNWSARKTQTRKRMLKSCFLSSFVEFHSTVLEEKSKMSQPIRGQGGHLVFPIGPKNTNLVKDVGILLPVKFRWILFSRFRVEVENVSANQRPGRPSFFNEWPEKHKLRRGHWDLASY